MTIRTIGLSHHSAPLDVRERFVYAPDQTRQTLDSVLARGHAQEAVLLSTCNRTELYFVTPADGSTLRAELTDALAARAQLSREQAGTLLYQRDGRAAVEHLFRVAASLDSAILGEPQIQGQVREAYEIAARSEGRSRAAGPVLSRLFDSALSVGARVRAQTTLGQGAASVPGTAVKLARKIFGTLRDRTAAVIGSGEMSKLSLECLRKEGVREATVVSRTKERATPLAHALGADASGHEDVPALLKEVDIMVTATSAPHTVITAELARRALPRGRRHPLLIVDIALPRDVEPAVGEIENVFLYNLDDLQHVVEDTFEQRRSQLPVAQQIINEAVDDFMTWYESLEVAPVIRELRQQAEAIREQEVARALRSLSLSEQEASAVDALTRQILAKVLHGPTIRLKEAATNGHGPDVLRAVRYLLNLSEEEKTENG